MRTAAMMAVALAAMGLAGCSNVELPPGPVVAQAAESADVLTPPAGSARPAERTRTEDASAGRTTGVAPAGPLGVTESADPTYREVPLASPGPATIATAGPFRMRNWPTAKARFVGGAVGHMPRWLADPYDDSDDVAGRPFGWSGNDLLAFVYCPGRFLANVVALPVSVFVHPLWSVQTTDRTATVVEGERGAEVHPAGSSGR